ncbi:MAG: hypothetical protein JWM80_4716 [Cyanobacteria bacterium RYN_339]|nr:hypothetical protein [Cyanobacteria bacterium RYN_339]
MQQRHPSSACKVIGGIPALALAAALVACSSSSSPHSDPSPEAVTSFAAPASSGSLVVNDAVAANPALVEVNLAVPAGLNVPAHTLRVPAGVQVTVLAVGLPSPRFMAFDPAGNLLVGTNAREVYRYPAMGGAIVPAAAPPAPLLSGLAAPSSVAFYQGWLYVGETTRVTRYRYNPTGPLAAPEVVVPDLPAGGHNTRTVAFGPDGRLYVAVGSSCNICDETDERRAAVLRYEPDGSGYVRVAHGLRNPVGLAFQPGTGALWAAVNERDMQGNEIPPDLVTRVSEGADYGWPRCLPPDARPQTPGSRCAGVTPPTIGIQAHSAPLGIAFASSLGLPEPYRDGLFVAQHGSWNRQPPAAPKLLHVAFDADGAPTGVKIFVEGWADAAGNRWGRPVGVLPAPDGSLIVSDDYAGLLYRITGGMR